MILTKIPVHYLSLLMRPVVAAILYSHYHKQISRLISKSHFEWQNPARIKTRQWSFSSNVARFLRNWPLNLLLKYFSLTYFKYLRKKTQQIFIVENLSTGYNEHWLEVWDIFEGRRLHKSSSSYGNYFGAQMPFEHFRH